MCSALAQVLLSLRSRLSLFMTRFDGYMFFYGVRVFHVLILYVLIL